MVDRVSLVQYKSLHGQLFSAPQVTDLTQLWK